MGRTGPRSPPPTPASLAPAHRPAGSGRRARPPGGACRRAWSSPLQLASGFWLAAIGRERSERPPLSACCPRCANCAARRRRRPPEGTSSWRRLQKSGLWTQQPPAACLRLLAGRYWQGEIGAPAPVCVLPPLRKLRHPAPQEGTSTWRRRLKHRGNALVSSQPEPEAFQASCPDAGMHRFHRCAAVEKKGEVRLGTAHGSRAGGGWRPKSGGLPTLLIAAGQAPLQVGTWRYHGLAQSQAPPAKPVEAQCTQRMRLWGAPVPLAVVVEGVRPGEGGCRAG